MTKRTDLGKYLRFHSLGRGLLHLTYISAVLSLGLGILLSTSTKLGHVIKIMSQVFTLPMSFMKLTVKHLISVYNEVIDEWSNQFPEIENLLTVLQTIQVETFDFNDFSEKCRNEFAGISDGVIRQYINFLFDNSLIGQKQGRWEYVSSLPNLKINLQNEFRTHHALKYRLHLIESRPSQKHLAFYIHLH